MMTLTKTYHFTLIKEKSNQLMFKLGDSHHYASLFILEEDLFRVMVSKGEEFSPAKTWLVAPDMEDLPFEGRSRFDLTGFTLPAYHVEKSEDVVTVYTKLLKAVIKLDGFKITWLMRRSEQDSWRQVAMDRNTQAYNFDGALGTSTYHYLQRTYEESYYGLGEKAGETNRYGRRFRMLNLDPMGYDAEWTDPLYKHIPFYITRNEKEQMSYGLFYDSTSESIFDMGNEMDNYHGLYRYYEQKAGDLDYYFIAGPEVSSVVKRYTWLTGKTIFPPKWSLGYSGSTMTYTDAPNAQEQLEQFLADCEKNDILCDSFQLSSGYTSIDDKRYVFNWNHDKFPDIKGFVQSFADKGIRLCANIKPCLLQDHPMFEELKKENMFIMNAAGDEPEMVQFWDDIGAYLDFTNPKTVKWWKAQVEDKLLKYGIQSTWNDNNEFEIWSETAQVNGFGNPLAFDYIRSLQPILMMKASYEAQKENNPNERPYLISRSGAPGMQRYVQTWTGDNYTSWKTLKYNNKMAVGLSLSGIYNIGHDVGGFAGPAPESELLVRWVQNGIFYPRFTIHSWNEDKTVNVPWMYEETTEAIANLIKFRYTLQPYLYTALYRAHAYYEPMIKSTFYDFEGDQNTFKENDDFLLGEFMLVPSVVEKGATVREVYLPHHKDGWFDFHTGDYYEGGQSVTLPAALEEKPPLLVKGGAIIPINCNEPSFNETSDEQRAILLFPSKGNQSSHYELYEDDGITAHYEEQCKKININMETTEERINVSLHLKGDYEVAYEELIFTVPAGETREVYVNNEWIKIEDGRFSVRVR